MLFLFQVLGRVFSHFVVFSHGLLYCEGGGQLWNMEKRRNVYCKKLLSCACARVCVNIIAYFINDSAMHSYSLFVILFIKRTLDLNFVLDT